ncbi:hypothetical protein ACIQWL_49775 [Streptomyces mirabilis]|uniref:hypothetical protein n=2 Tax=Streptomyces mirabilis TaxID=68239 RepID=UPI00225167C7|nr:hypothetical protein [Streptomyces mirabilis]MCX4418165.1 hypothetical protein [Streptomyces mirabilis]
MIHERNRVALARLIDPLEAGSARWGNALTDSARNMLLMEVGRRSRAYWAYWAWDEQVWTMFVASVTGEIRHRRRAHLVAWGYLFDRHRRLHHRVGMPELRPLADFVFGHGAVDPALEQVCTLLERWETSPKSQPELVRSSVLDALLSAGSPHLKDVTLELLQDLVADHPASSARRRGFFKMSRVLAANASSPSRSPAATNSAERVRRPWPRSRRSGWRWSCAGGSSAPTSPAPSAPSSPCCWWPGAGRPNGTWRRRAHKPGRVTSPRSTSRTR